MYQQPRSMRFRPRSSTDGKPIERIQAAALEAMIAREHAEPFRRYLADGSIVGLGEPDDDDGDTVRDLSSFDGMIAAEEADDADPKTSRAPMAFRSTTAPTTRCPASNPRSRSR